MTYVGMFEEANLIKKLKARVKNLMAINQEHQTLNGKLRAELSIEKKNHDLVKEEVQILNIGIKLKDKEIGRLMHKVSKLQQ